MPEFSADDLGTWTEGAANRDSSPATASDLLVRRPSEARVMTQIKSPELVTDVPPSLQQPLLDLALTHFARIYFRGDQSSIENLLSLTRGYFPPNTNLTPKSHCIWRFLHSR